MQSPDMAPCHEHEVLSSESKQKVESSPMTGHVELINRFLSLLNSMEEDRPASGEAPIIKFLKAQAIEFRLALMAVYANGAPLSPTHLIALDRFIGSLVGKIQYIYENNLSPKTYNMDTGHKDNQVPLNQLDLITRLTDYVREEIYAEKRNR